MQEPSTSQNKMLERQLSVEVSSFRMPTEKDQDIKEIYKELKSRNQRLKAQNICTIPKADSYQSNKANINL